MRVIDGVLLKKMMIAGANELNENKQLVDALNVFPVPDGDTGTNMSLTALAAAKECEKVASNRIDEVAKAIANGSLRGARGNSGVILSQLIRGFAKGLSGQEEADTQVLAKAVRQGVETAYKAVMKPKEGTILTVARACAESAEAHWEEMEDVGAFLKQILSDGNEMLAQTKEMLPVLKQADVVDAGGKGLLFVLLGGLKALDDKAEISLPEETLPKTEASFEALGTVAPEDIQFGYCTEFFVEEKNVPEETVEGFRDYLLTMGDSLVLVADEEMIKVHVHTNHPGQVLEKALTIGPLNGLKIENMRIQHTSKIDFSNAKPVEVKQKEVGFVSVSMGDGLSEIFRNLGVDRIIEGGQTMNPSTEDILQAIAAVPAKHVVILPNNKNIILASQQAAKLTKEKKVFVVPTKSVPEGMTAMISYDPSLPVEEAVTFMEESLETVTTCSVTYAVRDTVWGESTIAEGDIIGILNGQIVSVDQTVADCTRELVGKAVNDSSEVICIYYGADITEEAAQQLAGELEEIFDQCEVEVHAGGQPLYYYIISVE